MDEMTAPEMWSQNILSQPACYIPHFQKVIFVLILIIIATFLLSFKCVIIIHLIVTPLSLKLYQCLFYPFSVKSLTLNLHSNWFIWENLCSSQFSYSNFTRCASSHTPIKLFSWSARSVLPSFDLSFRPAFSSDQWLEIIFPCKTFMVKWAPAQFVETPPEGSAVCSGVLHSPLSTHTLIGPTKPIHIHYTDTVHLDICCIHVAGLSQKHQLLTEKTLSRPCWNHRDVFFSSSSNLHSGFRTKVLKVGVVDILDKTLGQFLAMSLSDLIFIRQTGK